MNVLMSAFSCEPGRGSEPGVGWKFAVAAAAKHEVWLLTRPHRAKEIESALIEMGITSVHPLYVTVPRMSYRFARAGKGYLAYLLWQRQVARLAPRLVEEYQIDIVHHTTFASDWLPCGLMAAADRVPMVWGPVGGANPSSLGFPRILGVKGWIQELVRVFLSAVPRRIMRRVATRRATLVVAQNHYVAEGLARHADVVVEPNAAIDPPEGLVDQSPWDDVAGWRVAVCVGRLEPYKGVSLAVEALARPAMAGWRLEVYGEGPERGRLVSLAARYGVEERVRFHDVVPVGDVWHALGFADALIFPSLRDGAGWAVAEALSIGCPVVAFPRCGPSTLIKLSGVPEHFIDESDPVNSVGILLSEIKGRVLPNSRFTAHRLPQLLDDWYVRACNRFSESQATA